MNNAIKLSVVSNKGGVAKTTSVVNIAGAIAKVNPKKKVLIVDLDGQGNVASSFGISGDEIENTIYDVIMGTLTGHIQEKAIIKNVVEGYNIDLLPANADMNYVEIDLIDMLKEAENPSEIDTNEFYYSGLKVYIEEIEAGYDYVIFDTPPEIKLATYNALAVSDYVIIPFEPEATAIQGVSKSIVEINRIIKEYNPKLKIAGVLATKVKERTVLHSTMLNEIRKISAETEWKVLPEEISESIKLSEAVTFDGKPITLTNEKHKTAQAYINLVKYLMNKEIL